MPVSSLAVVSDEFTEKRVRELMAPPATKPPEAPAAAAAPPTAAQHQPPWVDTLKVPLLESFQKMFHLPPSTE